MKISVSILGSLDNYKESVLKLNETTSDYLHLDIMDNTFTDTSSFTYDDSKIISNLNNKKLDIHIMSNNLDNILYDYIKLNPDIISFHYEAVKDIKKYIKILKENNIKASLAINPDTNIEDIKEYLDDLDMVLVMSVYAGYGGQKYIETTTDKLKKLKEVQNDYNFLIEVDGGINNETINKVRDYVDIVVSGNYITKSNNYQNQINDLIN